MSLNKQGACQPSGIDLIAAIEALRVRPPPRIGPAMSKPVLLAFLFSALAACSAPGPKISAHDAWARETGASDMAAVYVTIENKGGADELTGVRANIADATLHETTMEDGVMRMRPIEAGQGLVVPSNGKLVLAPGGAHVMLMGLRKPLTNGDRFDVTLLFDRSRPERVTVTVRPAVEQAMAH